MHNPTTLTTITVTTPDALRQAQAIRHAVFVVEQGIPAALDSDGLDDEALHALILDGEQPVATGRLVLEADKHGNLARIAVLPSHRGLGLGKRIVQHLEALAQREGVEAVHLHAHTHLEPFYQSLGYTSRPGTTNAGGHPLIHMVKTL